MFKSERKIIVFVRNKLITLDTVLPLLLEMKDKYNVSSEIVVFNELAHNAIYKNVVIKDIVSYVGQELFITKGIKFKILRRVNILISLARLTGGFIRGNKIIHFGHLDVWPLKVIALFFNKNIYQMQGTAYKFNYPLINRALKKRINFPDPIGKNIILCTESIENTKFYNVGVDKKIFLFESPRIRRSWVNHINSKSDYYFKKYHPNIDISNGFIVFILGTIDMLEHKYKLFHSTMKILSNNIHSMPILLKPHAYTEMDTVKNAIEGLDLFHVTYLHPSILATKAKVFISNNFSNTFADAHSFGVETIEYSCYDPKVLKITNYKSIEEKFVDCFIHNNEEEFSEAVNNIECKKYKQSSFNGFDFDSNKLFESMIS